MAIQMDQSISLGFREASHLVHYVCVFSHSSLFSFASNENNIYNANKNSKSEKKTSLRAKTIDGEVKEFYEVFAP